MHTKTIFKLLKILLSLVLITLVVYFLITPQPVVPLIFALFPDASYPIHTDAIERDNYTLYTTTTNSKLLVWFNGGAFLASDRTQTYGFLNKLYDRLEGFDILVFDYPVRFKSTIKQTMLAINKTLSQFLNYKEYHAGSLSAGSLLLGAFCQKETSPMISKEMQVPQIGITFQSFIGVSGLYETQFYSEILTSMFKFYIMRNTPGYKYYTAYGLNIPKLIISCKNDFLYLQTLKYIAMEPNENIIYENPNLTHGFCLWLNHKESFDVIDSIVDFIKHQPSI